MYHIHGKNNKYIQQVADVASEMTVAAIAFLESLNREQYLKCVFETEDEERFHWDYRPVRRVGLPFKEMDSAQQRRAFALMATGLSRKANITALNIMSLEKILAGLEGSYGNHLRDPELYFVTIFGKPGSDDHWSWRVEGHHLSLNFVVISNDKISSNPQFFGANPAKVPTGPLRGFATLPREEELARKLLHSFDKRQTIAAVNSDEAPADIITSWASHIRLDDPVGIKASDFQEDQRKLLVDLIGLYLGRVAQPLFEQEMELLDKEGIGNIHFSWAGSHQLGDPHYYRLHGPSLVIEYDNTQNNANHIHSVWRNTQRDWGEDLLLDHYAHSHASRSS